MRYSVGLLTARTLAEQFFSLSLPLPLDTLKKAYQKEARRLHPDNNLETDTTAQFQEMHAAYLQITRCAEAFSESVAERSRMATQDGRQLHDLGLGLGALINGRDCPTCAHKGYRVTFEQTYVECPDCDTDGTPLDRCSDCLGTGKFTLRSKRVVDCRRCGGKGMRRRQSRERVHRQQFFSPFASFFDPNRCGACGGSRRKMVDDTLRPVYHICETCNGTGEERIYNPVIRKGALRRGAA